jgi:hypothetical protein
MKKNYSTGKNNYSTQNLTCCHYQYLKSLPMKAATLHLISDIIKLLAHF